MFFHIKESFLRVIDALIEFIACELLITDYALELNDTGEELPEEISPWDFLSPEWQHKFVEFECLVSHVRCLDLTVSINENLTFVAKLPPSLTRGEESVAVGAAL